MQTKLAHSEGLVAGPGVCSSALRSKGTTREGPGACSAPGSDASGTLLIRPAASGFAALEYSK